MSYASRLAAALPLGIALVALTPPAYATPQEEAVTNRTILRTFQGATILSPFADSFKVQEQVRFATGFRLSGVPDFSTLGAMHFFALPPSQWERLGYQASDGCKIDVLTTLGRNVTLTYYRLPGERFERSEVDAERAQACFVSGVFRHFGVDDLPSRAKLAQDRDFLTVKGAWYTRLYNAVKVRGDR